MSISAVESTFHQDCHIQTIDDKNCESSSSSSSSSTPMAVGGINNEDFLAIQCAASHSEERDWQCSIVDPLGVWNDEKKTSDAEDANIYRWPASLIPFVSVLRNIAEDCCGWRQQQSSSSSSSSVSIEEAQDDDKIHKTIPIPISKRILHHLRVLLQWHARRRQQQGAQTTTTTTATTTDNRRRRTASFRRYNHHCNSNSNRTNDDDDANSFHCEWVHSLLGNGHQGLKPLSEMQYAAHFLDVQLAEHLCADATLSAIRKNGIEAVYSLLDMDSAAEAANRRRRREGGDGRSFCRDDDDDATNPAAAAAALEDSSSWILHGNEEIIDQR